MPEHYGKPLLLSSVMLAMSVTTEYYGEPERILPVVPTIGRNIRKFRKSAGFKTGKAFAQKLGVPPSRVSEWETNRYALPDTATLINIAKVVRRSVDEILNGIDPQLDRIMGVAKTRERGVPLTDEELWLLNDLADIDTEQRSIVLSTARKFAGRTALQTGATDSDDLPPRVRDALVQVETAAAAEQTIRKAAAKRSTRRATRG